MTQVSFFWDGTGIGDANQAEYSSDEFNKVMRDYLTYDRTVQGVLVKSGYNALNISNPAGLTIRLASGMAMVDGTLYRNDADVDFTLSAAPGANTDYYTVVLRKDFAAQTVRLAMLGPVNAGPFPSPTQVEGTTWDIPIAQVWHASTGTITIFDRRRYLSNYFLIADESIKSDAPAASLTISSIPPQCSKLILQFHFNDIEITGQRLGLRFNGDSGATNYAWMQRRVELAGPTEVITVASDDLLQLVVPTTSPSGPVRGEVEILCDAVRNLDEAQNFLVTAFWKTFGGAGYTVSGEGYWTDDAQITSLTLIPESSGSAELTEGRVRLWGVV